MKTKLLTACVAAALLAGCGSDGKDPVKQVQAYDGAIWGIPGTYSCADGTSGPIPRTNYDGFANIPGAVDSQVISDPAQCTFSFGLTDAQKADPSFVVTDTSNGKNMKNVSYSVPRGFAEAGSRVIASPLSTYMAFKLGDEAYTDEKAKEVLEDLGVDVAVLESANFSPSQLLRDTDNVIAQLGSVTGNQAVKDLFSKVVATTHVLSDALVANGTDATSKLDPTQLASYVEDTAKNVLVAYPAYPVADETKPDEKVVINLANEIKKALDETTQGEVPPPPAADKVKENTQDAKPPVKPEDPNQPPTGTGTGTGGNGGSTGD
ncbi:hypothetical protein BOO91_19835 [Vibrio navarrensis]|uniref:hypothetical protein n=1 Tax=Vibrio navarrensis TaxID=29495 RepID=UPI001865A9E8|nr:hypothetical protein [Vibrio navarrensis]MBE3663178.1 hypothetical protein [Vibrio navarrensis]